MKIHARLISKKLIEVSKLYPAILVSGPRQVGKTTLCRSLFPQHRWCLLDNLALLDQAQNDPQLFLQNNPPPLIIDEAQRAGNIFLAVKNYIDTRQPAASSFVLSGSQPLHLMRNVSESLAGRIGLLNLLPMGMAEITENSAYTELLKVFDNPPIGQKVFSTTPLQELVVRGGLPKVALSGAPESEFSVTQHLSDYIATYLTKDLREISNIKDITKFERFLRLLSTASATVANISELAANAGIPQATAENWLSILVASMLVYEVPGFSSNIRKREIKRPKLFLCDSGLQAHLLGYNNSSQVSASPYSRATFETFVFQSIKANLDSSFNSYKLLHWRSAERDEVDLIIECNVNQHIAVEIKKTAKPGKDDLLGIKKFMACTKSCSKAILVTAHEECYWIDRDILHLPVWMI